MGWKNGFKRIRFRKKREMPGGLWMRCPGCSNLQYRRVVEQRLRVCPECNHHFEISAPERIAICCDEGSFEERFAELCSTDPLGFVARKAYRDRLERAQQVTGLRDACVVGTARIEGQRCVFGCTDSRFLRGSMGSVTGEKIARAIELATELQLPFVFVSGSGGGARMDEGVLSLMQMAKTSAALARFDERGGFFISVLTNPTMGGAMASFAALGDVIIAEPKALLGFAGPNVIRQTIKADLPEGFQTSEFLLEKGFIDMIVDRPDLKATLGRLLRYADPGSEAAERGRARRAAVLDHERRR
ncbi:MAG: acetyl-CoA carboxylase carboxyltransferase subunit beta [Planctomycetota bacterium]|nr:MAG: acetyl-CoA carboxylase carboxyltransferase subunit beta [Planctomycetota bacterium]